MPSKFVGLKLHILAWSAALIVLATPASAYVLQISATSFVRHGEPDGLFQNQGALTNTTGELFAAVDFPVNGDEVCRFSLVYGDSDENDGITAELFRKAVDIGGEIFASPTRMARVVTTGAVNTVRRISDDSIAARTIANQSAFYYVRLSVPLDTLNPIGVQIDVRPTC